MKLRKKSLISIFCCLFLLLNLYFVLKNSKHNNIIKIKTIEKIDTLVIRKKVLDTLQCREWLYSKALTQEDSIIIAAVIYSDSLIMPVTRILTIAYSETRFISGIKNSHSSARGLMQVLKTSAIFCGLDYQRLCGDIDYEIFAGVEVMKAHYNFNKSVNSAIIGYSGGVYSIWKLKILEKKMFEFLFKRRE